MATGERMALWKKVVAGGVSFAVAFVAGYYAIRSFSEGRAPEEQAAPASVPATTEAAKEAAPPAEVESTSSDLAAREADDSLLSEDADTAAAAPMREKTAKTSRFMELRAKSDPMIQAVMDIWAEEDEVYAKAPRYDSVKADVQSKAEELLESINRSDTEAVIALARKELDAFWEAGGLGSPDSYEHAYVARAIAETALEQENENFALLSLLREAIGATTPTHLAAYDPNPEATKELWPVVDKQREMILAGRVPVCSETMCVMFDWADMAATATKDAKAPLPAWQWLYDNADAAGWSAMKQYFEQAIDGVNKGYGVGMDLYSTPYDGRLDGELMRFNADTMRMLPSMKGWAKYAAMRKGMWESPRQGPGK